MNKFSFIGLLATGFFGWKIAFAEIEKSWEIISVDNEAVYFVDRNSIVISDKGVGRVWQLKNFRGIKRVPPQSISAQMDYDCKGQKQRIFLKHHHSGVMAKGRLRVANTEGQFDWKPLETDVVTKRIYSIICGQEPIKEPEKEKLEIKPESDSKSKASNFNDKNKMS
jgi:hypothetical protein